ncbi:MAG: hypothetical protein L0338_34585 [Acidobacteria bacterium]|nr:hypothetical protein [Acidobacteriota bacterium]
MHLVLIETSGNQNYIFSTNKLRESVGASQLTYLSGTQYVLEAVEHIGGPKGLWNPDGVQMRTSLTDPNKNPPIGAKNENVAEVIIATSGKALVLVKQVGKARELVQTVTLRALKEAPGLDICGVVSEEFDWTKRPLHEVIKEVHERYEELRARRASPLARYQTLPVVQPCRSSGLPAAKLLKEGEKGNEVLAECSQTSIKKRDKEVVDEAFNRIEELAKNSGFDFVKNPDRLEKQFKELRWVAVVHCDGNGLGQIMLNFHRHAKAENAGENGEYVEKLRRFSAALEACTEEAFQVALQTMSGRMIRTRKGQKERLPLVPLVLGGDDLTLICDGEQAMDFMTEFLQQFEAKTTEKNGANRFGGIIPEIAKEALGLGRLSACAGIAVVKPHFPFHAAYHLAEQLLQSAKQVKKQVCGDKGPYPCSAIDFHILYDASAADLDAIRSRLTADQDGTFLTAGPYVVTDLTNAAWSAGVQKGKCWARDHAIVGLKERVAIIAGRKIPSSQLHDLREGLFQGTEAADARVRQILHRYPELKKLLERESPQPSLFRSREGGKTCETRLLDAMDAAELRAWKEERHAAH